MSMARMSYDTEAAFLATVWSWDKICTGRMKWKWLMEGCSF
jgi:hypothetical protein